MCCRHRLSACSWPGRLPDCAPKEFRKKEKKLADRPSRLCSPPPLPPRGTVPWERYPPWSAARAQSRSSVSPLSLLGDPPRPDASARFGLALSTVVGFSIFSASVTGQQGSSPPPCPRVQGLSWAFLALQTVRPHKRSALCGRWERCSKAKGPACFAGRSVTKTGDRHARVARRETCQMCVCLSLSLLPKASLLLACICLAIIIVQICFKVSTRAQACSLQECQCGTGVCGCVALLRQWALGNAAIVRPTVGGACCASRLLLELDPTSP